MLNELYIVIVVYGINYEETKTFKSLISSIESLDYKLNLLVYDNSPKAIKQNTRFNNLNLNYISDVKNSGLSVAYNIAAQMANQIGKKWLLILDQDSILPLNYFSLLSSAIQSTAGEAIIAPMLKQGNMILSPCIFKHMKGSNFRHLEPGKVSFKNVSIFNSGMVINLHAFFIVNGYSEEIPLDFSDHYFIDKIKKKYSYFLLTSIVIKHELSTHSDISKDKVLSRFIQYSQGARVYSQKNNGSYLVRLWTFLRALKLSLKYSDVIFLTAFWENFFKKHD